MKFYDMPNLIYRMIARKLLESHILSHGKEAFGLDQGPNEATFKGGVINARCFMF